MTKPLSVNEIQWTETLKAYLEQPEPSVDSSQIEAEAMRLGGQLTHQLRDNIIRPVQVTQPIRQTSIVQAIKPNFQANIVDYKFIRAIEPQVLQRSQLAIRAKPQWKIAARQVYKQTPPVPSISNPVRVGDFLLFPDPVQDYVNLDSSTELVKNLSKHVYTKDGFRDRIPMLEQTRTVRQGVHHLPNAHTVNISRHIAHHHLNGVRQQKPQVLNHFRVQKMRIQVRRAFFATISPRRQDFRLIVRRNSQLQVEGGTAYLMINTYTQDQSELLGSYRNNWTSALADAGYGTHLWKFLPVSLRNISPSLSLNDSWIERPTDISINVDSGIITLVIHLSSAGAQIWQQAIEQRQPQKISGICHFQAQYYARQNERLQIKKQSLQATLAELLKDCGPETIQIINPEVTLEPFIQIEGSQMLESATLNWQSNHRTAELRRVFDTDGGTLTDTIVTRDLDTVAIDWSAQIRYKPAGWPAVSQTGHLNPTDLTEILKPASSQWIQEYTLYTVYMAGRNQMFTTGETFDDIEVDGTLTIVASYLSAPLTTTMELNNFDITHVPFPQRPGQQPESVTLTITTRSRAQDKVIHTQTRRLGLADFFLNTKIYADGNIEIQSGADPIAENSIDANIFSLLTQF